MNAEAILSAQKTIRVLAVALIVVGGIGGTIVVAPALGGGHQGTPMHLYNVTFIMLNATGEGSSGSAGYRSTEVVLISLNGTNITGVNFTVSFQDNSVSPATDPAVDVMIQGPNGTGSASGRISGGSDVYVVAVPNDPPANTTIEATDEADAVAKAGGNQTNASLGSGEWTVTIDVGAPLFGRIRVGGSISYTVEVAIVYFAGKAEKVS
jgi:hypothetical protein